MQLETNYQLSFTIVPYFFIAEIDLSDSLTHYVIIPERNQFQDD